MTRLIVLLLVLALPLTAVAEIYSWTDASGTVHFTEDISQVPKQYRKKLTVRDESLQPVTPAAPAASTPVVKQALKPAPATNGTAAPAVAEKAADNLYGGKSAAAWQAEFREKRAALQAVDNQIKQLQADMQMTKNITSADKIAGLNARRAALSQQYEAAAASLNQLVEQANQAGLPPEFAR